MVKIKNCFLLLALFGLFSCSQYYRIDEQYDKGEFRKAYDILQEVRNKNSTHYQRRFYRIVTRLALNGETNFISELRTITLSNENDTREFANYAHFANAYGSFLAAVEPRQYSAVVSALSDLKKTPDEFLVYAYKVRGISWYKTGNYTNAIADLNQSYGMTPYVDSLYFIGLCYYNQEDHRTAASYFNRVIGVTQNPFFVSLAYYQLGEIDYYSKKYSAALEKYVEAVNRYSDSADYAMKINRCLRKLKYYTISPKFAKIALRIRSDYADAWFFLNMN